MRSPHWSRSLDRRTTKLQPDDRPAVSTAGASSPRLKRLRRLSRSSRQRAALGQFVIEGPTLVGDALAAGVDLVELWVGESVQSQWSELAEEASRAGAEVIVCGDGPLSSALDTQSSRPLAAVATAPWSPRPIEPEGPVLALVECGDPGNVGTLTRTAEAAGFAAIALVGSTVDPGNAKVVRASAGALFRLPVHRFTDVTELASATSPRPLIATVVDDGDPYDQADLRAAVIMVGNEAHGLDPSQVAAATQRITIEMAGPTESLNVAAAGAVLAFESLRQRRTPS